MKILDDLYMVFQNRMKGKFEEVITKKVESIILNKFSEVLPQNVSSFLGNVNYLLRKKKEKEEPQIFLLRNFLKDKENELGLIENFYIEPLKKQGHANDVYLISNQIIDQNDPNTIDYYAKTFSDENIMKTKHGMLDPNEIFVYKILEYTGFGPECWFLIKNRSSSKSSHNKGNFILTRNVGKGEGINFLMDKEENQEIFEKIFLKSKKFAIEFSSAAAINDIISLSDTFSNAGNYGVVFYNYSLENFLNNKQLNIEDFKIMFIDHLPDSENGRLAQLNYIKQIQDSSYSDLIYSPRENLISSKSIKPHILIKLGKLNKEIGFSRNQIKNDVYNRICNLGEDKKKQMDKLIIIINKAKEDVLEIINKYIESFTGDIMKDPAQKLENYYIKIMQNLQIFDEKYRENTDLNSYGIQCIEGMSDKDISLNLRSLKYLMNHKMKMTSMWIEQEVLNQYNMIYKIKSWSNCVYKHCDFLSIVTVINKRSKKHAILLHGIQKNNIIKKITLIDPLSQQDSEFFYAINEIKNTLNNQLQVEIRIFYAGCQDKDYGTCADMSLIMLQKVIEKAEQADRLICNSDIIDKSPYYQFNNLINNNIG